MKLTYDTVDGETKESPFLNFLEHNRQAIKNEIFSFFPGDEEIKSKKFGLDKHWEMVIDYPKRGGKYVRPGLILLSCQASGGDISKTLTTAAAMEISEDWLLVHDDFEDKSLVRRGSPALQILHGDALAVNAGDHLHLIMWKILLANHENIGCELSCRVAEMMEKFLQVTCEGQYLELSWTNSGRIVSEDEYFEMVDRKTGWYTIIGPLHLGAIIAGNDAALEPLIKFGHNLGRAFQIHDDWLNVFSENTGKELGGDILEGKRTLLLIHLVKKLEEAGDTENLEYVQGIFKMLREEKTQDDVNRIIALYEKHGCKEAIRNQAKHFANKALAELDNVPYSDEGKVILKDAVDFIVNREL